MHPLAHVLHLLRRSTNTPRPWTLTLWTAYIGLSKGVFAKTPLVNAVKTASRSTKYERY